MAIARILPNILSSVNRQVSALVQTAAACQRTLLSQSSNDVFEHRINAVLCEQPFQQSPLERMFNYSYKFFNKSNLDALSMQHYQAVLKYAAEGSELEALAQKPIEFAEYKKVFEEINEKYLKSKVKIPDETIERLDKIRKIYDYEEKISRYSEIILASLRRLFSDKRMKVIGIGQSPAPVVEYLSLKGIDTAICPISELGAKETNIEKTCKSRDKERYIQYLKEFGFNINEIDTKKTHVFVDYSYSGNTIRHFAEFIKPRMPKKADTMFVSLQSLRESLGKELSYEEQEFASYFEIYVLCTSAVKSLFSPIFKLPLNEIGNIEYFHKISCPSDKTIAFNKLKVLMYENIYGKSKRVKD